MQFFRPENFKINEEMFLFILKKSDYFTTLAKRDKTGLI